MGNQCVVSWRAARRWTDENHDSTQSINIPANRQGRVYWFIQSENLLLSQCRWRRSDRFFDACSHHRSSMQTCKCDNENILRNLLVLFIKVVCAMDTQYVHIQTHISLGTFYKI
ncbi:hypothetical protein T07_11476 [Trichinella nelsoni]|uniref:Uncharacterized protein n=1 Tax=Trichinella nelsoni TaxID=6336 RepID=A0A0V0RFW2_9BILA|nr:hypothetical protein T07_11476 [Trichinella nelsoni]